jgi:hypothetical protein
VRAKIEPIAAGRYGDSGDFEENFGGDFTAEIWIGILSEAERKLRAWIDAKGTSASSA